MIVVSIWMLKKMIDKLNRRNMISKNKRERFKLNIKVTLLHIVVLSIAILTSLFQIVYSLAKLDSNKANDWETRLGTIDILLQAFISLIVCYVCWFLTNEGTKQNDKLGDTSESIHLPDENTEDVDVESHDSFRAKLNRDSRMLYEDYNETAPSPPRINRANNSIAAEMLRADSVFF